VKIRSVTDRFEVARSLREIATLLELAGERSFKPRAYRRAAEALDNLPDDLGRRVDEGRLTEIPGIGASLARVIAELWLTGRSSLHQRLTEELPPGSLELARVPGLTVRRIRALWDALGTRSLADVQRACEQGLVRGVPGFGAKTEARILEGIAIHLARKARVLLPEADRIASQLAEHLRESPAVLSVETAGELRRSLEVIGEVLLVAATRDAAGAVAAFRAFGGFARIDDEGRGLLPNGLAVRLVVTSGEQAGWALFEQTGPEAHVEELRARGAAAEPGASEPRIYELAGLPWIPQELRDAPDAKKNRATPALIEERDLLGLVHCHTLYSDGRDTIEAMARAAEQRGARYLTITDHSQSAFYAGGLDAERLARQWEEIALVQEKVGVRLLRGTEADILADGALDYPDSILEQLDVVIASVHGRMRMSEQEMTRRLVAAMRQPIFKIWGHALGRILLRRPPFACRVEEVLDAVAESRARIEINGDPHRLDLEPRWIRAARERQIRFVISTDAHSVRQLDYVRFGVRMARRGGLTRAEVLNTLDAEDFAREVRPRNDPSRRSDR
jgi:DNA polymerase (family X)